jgi:hypothetical protein
MSRHPELPRDAQFRGNARKGSALRPFSNDQETVLSRRNLRKRAHEQPVVLATGEASNGNEEPATPVATSTCGRQAFEILVRKNGIRNQPDAFGRDPQPSRDFFAHDTRESNEAVDEPAMLAQPESVSKSGRKRQIAAIQATA